MKHIGLMKKNSCCLLFMSAASVALLLGCEADPVKSAGFAQNYDMMKSNELVPFQKVWKDPSVKAGTYNEIMVVPVFTQKQLDKSWMEEQNIRTWLDDEKDDVKEFAKYTEDAFKKAIGKSKSYKLADKPGPRTLILELALVKVVPGKPVLGAAKNLAAPIIGGFRLIALAVAPARTAVSASTDSPMQASVAIEGNIRDSMTKKVVASFADREKQTSAIFNLEDFRAYGNLEQIVDEWARQFVECLDKRPLQTGVKVEEKLPEMKIINY